MKGVILAGGTGTRLFPATSVLNKHLLNVFDKPMIYYSLSLLMLCGIRDIIIVTDPKHITMFENLFGTGEALGINIRYALQHEPDGIVGAIKCVKPLIGNDDFTVILGDNFFYGSGLTDLIIRRGFQSDQSVIFCLHSNYMERFGCVRFDSNDKPISIIEKPSDVSNCEAITGLYVFKNYTLDLVPEIQKSARAEFEISTLNMELLMTNKLSVVRLPRGITWFDCGTPSDLLDASQFVRNVQSRSSSLVSCLEEISLLKGWIDIETLVQSLGGMGSSSYKSYLETKFLKQ